jgi:hypothetical protein
MEYLSLYDYLKKPAGGELGKEVAQAASKAGVKLQTREVDNPKYTGIVYLYPKDFLDFHFRDPEQYQIEDALPGEIDWSKTVLDDEDLPF